MTTAVELGFRKMRAISELTEKLRDYEEKLGSTNTLHGRSPCFMSQTVRTIFIDFRHNVEIRINQYGCD